MQKSEILEDRSKAKSKNNTPKKNLSLKIIKSPIRVVKKEMPESLSNIIKPKLYKNISKEDYFESENKTNNIQNSIFTKKELEAEISINNLLNNNKFNNNFHYKENDLNISHSENINKQNSSEMINEKNFKERSKRSFLGNIDDFPNNKFKSDFSVLSNNTIKEESDFNNMNIVNNAVSHSKDRHVRDLKIESNDKKIIPPNNLNNLKDIYKQNNEENEDLNNLNIKYEDISNLDDLDYIKHSNAKKKKEWKSWCLSEKELFYEAIANGANYTSLQKLFKNMNDVKIFNSK